MKKTFLKEKILDDFSLEYFILESQIEIPKSSLFFHSYGIEIVKKSGDILEIKQVRNIMYSEDSIRKLALTLAENNVTPLIMEEVINDYIKIIPHKINLKGA